MKTKLFLTLTSVVLFFGCQQMPKIDDPENLKQVLTDYFKGIENRDFEKMKAVTTDDFVLYEDGKVWNNDSIIKMVKSLPKYVALYKFDNFKINVDIENGNMFYSNHLDITINDTIEQKYDWIESATFKKIDGTWKMNFLHSTVKR